MQEENDFDAFDGRIKKVVKKLHRNGTYYNRVKFSMDFDIYVYDTIDRCIDKNLIKIREKNEGIYGKKGEVLLTEKGRRFIKWLDEGGENNA